MMYKYSDDFHIAKHGIDPIVDPSNCAEDLPKTLTPAEYVTQTARLKAEEVADRYRHANKPFDVIIGADTMIVFDEEVLGKPLDKDDAFKTLKRINGRSHFVYTGVSLIGRNDNINFHCETIVQFGDISELTLKNYVETGEPIGRAGSYAIQGGASAFVKSISGCYYNVVGLPVHELLKSIRHLLLKK